MMIYLYASCHFSPCHMLNLRNAQVTMSILLVHDHNPVYQSLLSSIHKSNPSIFPYTHIDIYSHTHIYIYVYTLIYLSPDLVSPPIPTHPPISQWSVGVRVAKGQGGWSVSSTHHLTFNPLTN